MHTIDFLPIITACGGAIVGSLATYVMERTKRRSAMNDARRKAYASWFTAEALLQHRTEIVSRRMVGFLPDRDRHEALMVEVKSLVDEGRTLVTAMNEAFLSERSRRVRAILSKLHHFLAFVVNALEFVAHKENLEFHAHYDSKTDIEVDALPDAEREEWISLRERFQKHDAECPFKSPEFGTELREALGEVHNQVERLRETLAGALSR